MRMFLGRLATITMVALSPMAIVTLAAPAVSSADCGGGQVVYAPAAGPRLVPGRADMGAVVGAAVGAAAAAASAVGDVSFAF